MTTLAELKFEMGLKPRKKIGVTPYKISPNQIKYKAEVRKRPYKFRPIVTLEL